MTDILYDRLSVSRIIEKHRDPRNTLITTIRNASPQISPVWIRDKELNRLAAIAIVTFK